MLQKYLTVNGNRLEYEVFIVKLDGSQCEKEKWQIVSFFFNVPGTICAFKRTRHHYILFITNSGYVRERRANRRCAALLRSVPRPKGARLSAIEAFTGNAYERLRRERHRIALCIRNPKGGALSS